MFYLSNVRILLQLKPMTGEEMVNIKHKKTIYF